MPELNLPFYKFTCKEVDGKTQVFDVFRKRYVGFTPEEEVRQRFARYLVDEKAYPASLMLTEYSLKLNDTVRRCDILVHKPAGRPAVLVECKAPSVKITGDTFDQAARYNMVFRVRYLMVTNGMTHYCCQLDFSVGRISFLSEIPGYETLEYSPE